MTMRTVERATTEERVGYLEGAYNHLPTKSDVFGVEKQLSDRIAQSRTELSDRIAESKTELSDRIAESRTESRTENAELRTEMREGFAQLRTEIAEAVADAQARTTRLIIVVAGVSIAAVTLLDRLFG